MNGILQAGQPETNSKKLVSPLYVFVWMVITLVMTSYLVWRNTSFFTPTDDVIKLNYLTPQKMREFGGMPTQVRVGLSVNEFRTFNMKGNEFIIDGILWFEFDPSHISLSTVEQFSFDRGEVLYRSAPTSYMREGLLFVRYDVRIKFSTPMSFKYFPLDDHRLMLALTYKTVSPSELILVSRDADFVVIPDMRSVGWGEFKHSVETGYVTGSYSQTDPSKTLNYPTALFEIDYGRKQNIRNTIIIVLPMLLLFFIALFSLIIDRDKWFTTVISLPVQTIAGLVAYRFVIEGMSPTVGYFIYSDYFFFIFLLLMFLILLIHTVGIHLSYYVRKIIIAVLNLIIIFFFAYLFWI